MFVVKNWTIGARLRLCIKDTELRAHCNSPVNYIWGGETRCGARQMPALNIYKSPITDLNEPFESDLGGNTMGEE